MFFLQKNLYHQKEKSVQVFKSNTGLHRRQIKQQMLSVTHAVATPTLLKLVVFDIMRLLLSSLYLTLPELFTNLGQGSGRTFPGLTLKCPMLTPNGQSSSVLGNHKLHTHGDKMLKDFLIHLLPVHKRSNYQ